MQAYAQVHNRHQRKEEVKRRPQACHSEGVRFSVRTYKDVWNGVKQECERGMDEPMWWGLWGTSHV